MLLSVLHFRHIEIQSRPQASRLQVLLCTFLVIGFALGLGALLLTILGRDPWTTYHAIFSASLFGGAFALSDTLVKATPLLLCGLGCALAFKARLWNVGAEGQLLVGAWAATGIASFCFPSNKLGSIRLILMAIASMTAGGIWSSISAALRAVLGVNEIISSLMLVYIAQKFLSFFIFGAWSENGFPLTPVFPQEAWLPRLADLGGGFLSTTWLSGLNAHAGMLLGLVICLVYWLVVEKSVWGFELRILGDSPAAARYIGINEKWAIFWTLSLSGVFAGLAGMIEVAGVMHRLQDRFSPGYGFVAIAVAWLGRLQPWGILLASVLFAALLVGAKEIQPAGIALMLQGVIMVAMVGGDTFLRYRLKLRKHAVEKGEI